MTDYIGILSHDEAERSEITQLSASGCGVTALLNVLVAHGLITNEQSRDLDWSKCILRTRENDAPLPQYLLSRSIAGCTGQDIVTSLTVLLESNKDILGTDAPISGTFFSYKEIVESENSLHSFIERNITEGKCLVATMNLQLLGNDAWHHQMIYGIDKQHLASPNVYCVNPVCTYPMQLLDKMLSTESVLLVRRDDILSRHSRPNGDTNIYEHSQWRELAVKEQIAALVEDSTAQTSSIETIGMMPFVVIPANYIGGLAVFSKL